MNNVIDISFCIPVYNAAEFIQECINSVFAQNLANFEIICIDDCSTDDSFRLLQKIADEHQEVIVLKNDVNQGVSATRNKAITKAKGKYIWFLDIDDILAPGAAQKLLDVAEEYNSDVTLGRCYTVQFDKDIQIREQGTGAVSIAHYDDAFSFFSTDQYGYTSYGIWIGLFSRELLIKHNLRFQSELTQGEDIMFYLEIALESKCYIVVDYYTYIYRLREGSLSRGKRNNAFHIRYCDNFIRLIEIAKRHPKYGLPQYQKLFDDCIIGRTEDCMVHLAKIDDDRTVREWLRMLKEKGYYPYKYVENAAFRKRKRINRYLYIEGVFWIIHWIYLLKMKTSH